MTQGSYRPRPQGGSRPQRRFYHRRKFCRFCSDSNLKIEYKDPQSLRDFLTERGKIMPRRITGSCAKHQREITLAIKRARSIALLPFVVADGR
ncbi:MAG: 30S ribosomal protein S18 [Syntrophales bacterium]|jgi:small subunit ribosomal protein S18|nr:30S ribosomal protein S18 [Syntrophales bacterium]NLN60848.1 30S ribosomal protein S18 [Deltaproteobacteria bacterium]